MSFRKRNNWTFSNLVKYFSGIPIINMCVPSASASPGSLQLDRVPETRLAVRWLTPDLFGCLRISLWCCSAADKRQTHTCTLVHVGTRRERRRPSSETVSRSMRSSAPASDSFSGQLAHTTRINKYPLHTIRKAFTNRSDLIRHQSNLFNWFVVSYS